MCVQLRTEMPVLDGHSIANIISIPLRPQGRLPESGEAIDIETMRDPLILNNEASLARPSSSRCEV